MEVLAEATSAAVAAATSAVVVYPLDTVLVRFQATSKRKLADPYADASSHGLWHRDLVNIVLDLVREPKTAKSVGGSLKASSADADEVISKVLAAIRKAYKGVGVKVVEAVVRNFVYFIWYKALKDAYDSRKGAKQTVASRLALATAAAVINQCCTAPLEVVSTNVQTSGLNYRAVIRKIFRREGVRGFYRGFLASLILCSNPAITNACFDRLKLLLQIVLRAHARRNIGPITDEETPLDAVPRLPPLTPTQAFLLGALSKALATVATYPYIRSKVLLHVIHCTRSFNDSSHEGRSPEPSEGSGTPPDVYSRSPATREGSSLTIAISPFGSPLASSRERGASSIDLKEEHSSASFPCSTAVSSASGLVTRSATASCHTSSSSPCFSFSSSPRLESSDTHSRAPPSLVDQSHDIQATGDRGISASHLPPRSGSMPNVSLQSSTSKRERRSDVYADTFVDPNAMLKAASFCLTADTSESPSRMDGGAVLSHGFDSPQGGNSFVCRHAEEVLPAPPVHVDWRKDTGIVGFMVSTLAQEGLPGLYKGLGLQLCKTLISSALLYMIKEKIHSQTRNVSGIKADRDEDEGYSLSHRAAGMGCMCLSISLYGWDSPLPCC
ncbi:carrier superfamily protein [Cystoisospora suis]|uniref:Carrier superfamily protein n=1 Tax=Cystoisospora suis TaxID=483139 RepID=A0A2C6LCL9_9APIC|nr:carrier superfamily protein [Cystoisospora suis]